MWRNCVGWSVVWSRWCVEWDWFIACRLMFFVIDGCCCEHGGYDNWKSSAVVRSCHAWIHQFPNMWNYGSWNDWEKEEGSTKEIVGTVRKEGFGTIWLEKRECVRTIERNSESELEQQLPTPASRDVIKTGVVVAVHKFSWLLQFHISNKSNKYVARRNIRVETVLKPDTLNWTVTKGNFD